MQTETPLDLFAGPRPLTGNVAKVKVLHELDALFAARPGLRVLDVGCVGPQPLDFWAPLLDARTFHLTGVDVWGLERAEKVVRERGWGDRVTLREGSGYNVGSLFPRDSFDVVIATQVLEHVARLDLFMSQVAAVARPGAEIFFTLDSAHYLPRFTPARPVRLAKNVVKKGLSLAGRERHYDLPWMDHEVAAACARAGLPVVEARYYNTKDLKHIHNQVIPDEGKNDFMRRWYALEEALNDQPRVREQARSSFMVLYVHARRSG
jgi:SAM-dependent methyltransferase